MKYSLHLPCSSKLHVSICTHIQPVFAQQSVRENVRTGRSPQQVLDDAMWGMFQEGWRMPWGADADHIKTLEDLDTFIDAGYTFYTIDAGDFVDNSAPIDTLAKYPEWRPRWKVSGYSYLPYLGWR